MHTRFLALLGLATLLSAVAPAYAQDARRPTAPPVQEARTRAPATAPATEQPAARARPETPAARTAGGGGRDRSPSRRRLHSRHRRRPAPATEQPGARGRAARASASTGVAAARPLHRAAVPGPGWGVGHRPADVPLLHPDTGEPVEGRRVVAVQGRDGARGLQAPVGDELPRQPLDRGEGRPVRERRGRQARHLRARGAAAREDRRLHRQQEGRPDEDRREAQGREHHASASTRSSTPA